MWRSRAGSRCSVFDAVNSRALTAVVIAAVFGLSGVALRPMENVERARREQRVSGRGDDLGAALTPQALMQGLLGDFRAVVADVLWLEAHGRVEARDLPGTETLLELVTVVDPRPLYFWVNGARVVAYDMPAWRDEKAGVSSRMADDERHKLTHEQAHRAVRRLETARRFHPDSAALWIEQANIELNCLGDVEAAAESYRRASEQADAPYFAARLHAELLRRLGRKEEALIWLVRLHPHLPPGDAAAGAALVLARIRELERELGIGETIYRRE